MSKFNHPHPLIRLGIKRRGKAPLTFSDARGNLEILASVLDINPIVNSTQTNIPEKEALLRRTLDKARKCGVQLVDGWRDLSYKDLCEYIPELSNKLFSYANVQFSTPIPAYVSNPPRLVQQRLF
ncbi:MAG: hypothetical protein NT076_02360 [Candidatus Pacearchaeota archaeon]|nr:hypothetical protein [Candidatus Pacearchaeota archaeon]